MTDTLDIVVKVTHLQVLDLLRAVRVDGVALTEPVLVGGVQAHDRLLLRRAGHRRSRLQLHSRSTWLHHQRCCSCRRLADARVVRLLLQTRRHRLLLLLDGTQLLMMLLLPRMLHQLQPLTSRRLRLCSCRHSCLLIAHKQLQLRRAKM